MLAHQLGFPLSIQVMSGLWNWEKLWKECGLSGGPGDQS
jgi:superfamily I DNA and RNA helicase